MAEIMVDLSSDDQTISVPLATVFGTGIARIEQTVTSDDPEIPNEITCTLTNGQQSKFYIKNGKDGYSPSITIEQGAEGYSITVTDEEGSHEYSIIVDSTLDAESANPIQNQAVAGAVTQLTSDITAEVTRATNAETAIRTEASQIYATKAALQSEENARSLADTSLSNNIDAETQRATQAEASIRLAIPSKTSQLTNDSGFLTSAPVSSVNGKSGAVNLSASDVGALPSSTVIPSKTSDLTNDSHFITASEAPVQSVNEQTGAVTIPTATTSSAGLMSSQDKANLDAVRGQIDDLKSAFSEVTEDYPTLANVDDVLIGYNWTQGSASNRAIIWVECLPNTDYFIRVPASTAFNDFSIVQKAAKDGGALSSSTISNGSEQTFTTVANAAFICLQFNGKADIISSDFDNYDLYLIEASQAKTAVDEVARSAKNKKYIFIGDSYCEGYNPDGSTTGWGARLKSAMNLADEDCYISCKGGTGFYHVSDGKTFSTLLDEAGAKVIKSAITDIVVCGGWNDNSESLSNVYSAVLAMIAKVRTEYPNAKLHLGMIGASNNATVKQRLQNTVLYSYQYGSLANVCDYLNNVEYALSESNLASDGIHPNADGQVQITMAIKQALETGSAYIPYRFYNQIKTS